MKRSLIKVFLLVSMLLPAQLAYAEGEAAGVDAFFGTLNGYLASVLFYDVMPGEGAIPFIVAWLIIGAVYLTIRFGFVNLRMMGHALQILRGKYRSSDDQGEVSPFQALTTALSATVGLGNIAGVAIAVSIGGPGATFWMIVAGFFGMTAKFTEVTLAQMYREFRPDGHVMGGAMQYLSKGFAEKGMPGIGKKLAVLFAILCVAASLGGGNAFQVSQALGAVQNELTFFKEYPWVFGVFMATAVGIVIIGGIKRIAHAAEALVPTMVFIYLTACLWIILTHITDVPAAISLIVTEAFAPTAVAGGMIGVIVQGFKRAAFSSEAGIGSAAIAHSAASVKYPVRQGFVALYEPFIDTVVICTMTALVIILTGVYNAPEHAALVEASKGAALTAVAFGSVISWFPVILSISVVLFAYSTMISWSYYGERCWTYVFGERFSMLYRLMFLMFIVLASLVSAGNILDFSDLLLLAMAFPNFLALYLLQGKVGDALKDYRIRLRNGQLDREVGR
ncbi:alanine or glycine:cation symporter, AGCS family [Mariprofundus aestuarium]|uniref:Alanine or glycine:cation symporter, AGCS family n=2 Tax=Mariprofundus aestuarium TaxID=1921086 RepID=A0A2K8KY99_MARES|nr:alanine/glycine:cation symporter family protein [Mariprofundus aestuarium]ATX79948.1 alanine or glycine:cation symporter, AGCS family [Mariprofundus aestuarium]